MKTLYRAVITITIFSVVTRLLGFLFHIYIYRELGPEMLGIYQVAFSLLGILMTLVSSGIPLSTAKMCAQYGSKGLFDSKSRVVGTSLIVSVVVSALLVLTIYLVPSIFGMLFADVRSVSILNTLLPAVIFSAIYSVFRGAMWGDNRYFCVSVTELIEQVVRIVATVIFFQYVTDGLSLAMSAGKAFSIACLVSAVVAVLLFFMFKHKISFGAGEYKNFLRSSSSVTGIRLAGSLSQPLAALIVPAQLILTGLSMTEAMSMYGVMMCMTASMLYIPMALVGSVGMALLPNISSCMAKKDYTTITSNAKQSFSVSLFFTFMFVPVYIAIGDSIGYILFNNVLSGQLLQFGAAAVVPIALCGLSSSILNGMSLEGKSFKNYLIGSAVMFLCFFAFTRIVGVYSVIIALTLGMGTISALNLRMMTRYIPTINAGLLKRILNFILLCIPVSIIGYFCSGILSHYMSTLLSTIISGLVILVLYCISCIAFGLIDFVTIGKIFHRKRKLTKPEITYV